MGSEGDTVRVIAGRYRLRERLGRGGMGVVWRAEDQLLGRPVAVKELDTDDSLSPREARGRRDRTLREARAVAQLRHPHVVVVHDVVEHEERLFIVMELVEGGSLQSRVFADGPVPAPEAARIALALLGALRTAHEAGVLHRDLKPANVLVDGELGRVVLTDFGIAHVNGATTLTETGSFVGSPEYTAPERMSGGRIGPECDLWSLGALLCAIVSGVSPFHRESLGGVLHAVVFDEIRPPAEAAALLPVVTGLLERDPARRLTAPEAERLLRAYLDTGRMPPAVGQAPPEHPAPGSLAPDAYVPTEPGVGLLRAPAAPAGPRRFGRPALAAAALLAAGLGAGVAAVALSLGDSTDSPGTPGSSATRTDSPAAPGSSATGTGPGPSASPPGGTAPAPPAGYRRAEDPRGFSLNVPAGYTRSLDGDRVFYLSPGSVFRIGVKEADPEEGGPLAVMRRAHAAGPDHNPGYRAGTVTETTHGEHPAALWEFTWDGFTAEEGPRHTFDLCWEEGGRMYDVWVSAPVGRLQEAKEHFDTAASGFQVTGRD
ncbi:serine/threonine protein kinase [Streptomyces albus]|uniref:non-specific serine/threonine protein kinase n=1 Tax=Streptomyces albus (strain ATCC 21838 / DSM 41398 / FERM P-419 / JCM 4703 / NBRC 107858) TaxID=1081613 RepID=A0A0B5F3Z9_STRA4|nr:serine/threonine protein kinase [Streptomyces albus]AOU79338.1 serine/threonine protein kinase [Streptomyces albus]AYN35065.1 serine/threonine protein kinase [Streptomyces albus]